MLMKGNNKVIWKLSWTMMAMAILLTAFPVQAQMSVSRIVITDLNSSQFPDVKVSAIIRDANNEPISSDDVRNLELLENGNPVDFEFEEIDSNLEIMFVVDMTPSMSKYSGKSGQTRMQETQAIIRGFIDMMHAGDSAGLVVVTAPDKTNYVQTLTSNMQNLAAAVESLPTLEQRGSNSNSMNAVLEGLNELSRSTMNGKSIQSVVFITSGLVSTTGLLDATNRSNTLKIPIHTFLTRSDNLVESYVQPLTSLTKMTGGVYSAFTDVGSLGDTKQWFAKQRSQIQFSYKSAENSNSERTVMVRAKTGMASSSVNYSVRLEAPELVIDSPVKGQVIQRAATTYNPSVDQYEPATVSVNAHVNWRDGFERPIVTATLLVDGRPVGQPVQFPGSTFSFTWDVRDFRQSEQEVRLSVQMEDELGIKAESEVVPVKFVVSVPPQPTIVSAVGGQAQDCSKAGGTFAVVICNITRYSGLIALGLATIALVLVVVFRSKIGAAAVHVGDAVRETVARITRPPQTQVGAYLTVLRGAEDLPRNKFPIYINTLTPIGRDRRQADIVFDESADHSVVSRLHCQIQEEMGQYKLKDLGSSHGTFINGSRLPELGEAMLSDGDQIEVGPVERGGILILFQLASETGDYDDIVNRETKPNGLPDLVNRETGARVANDMADRQTKPF